MNQWELSAGEVHCWRFVATRSALDKMAAVLCPEERARADRFRFDLDRIEYTVCRGALRFLLARYLNDTSGRLTFAYSARGKPTLPGERNPAGVEFSVTHSRGTAMIAVTRGHAVGVDVERVRPLADLYGMVETCFAVEEQEEFRRLPKALQPRAFFAGWTRKEAFLKATGDGLDRPLKSFAVTISPDSSTRLLRLDNATDVDSAWTLTDLDTGSEFTAAVAVACPAARVDVRELNFEWIGLGEGSKTRLLPNDEFGNNRV